jgi:hypothetical protein
VRGLVRRLNCPSCDALTRLRETRRTELARIMRIRLYHCEQGHQFETAEVVVGPVVPIQRKKTLIYTHSVKRNERDRRQMEDYVL